LNTILAIESSCDDTSVAVIRDGKVLSNETHTQLSHEEYGGVVPEVASREHILHILPVVQKALKTAEIDMPSLNVIAFTKGPGLLGSLLVGSSFAKGMSLALGIPLISVNHMRAHILAHFAEDPKPEFPFLCLTVSGGHTQLVLVEDYTVMHILGQTLDDAVGEAFDKTGKLLGLPYPAGPMVDQLASQRKASFSFAEPDPGGLDFSFSGFKTSVLYFLRTQIQQNPKFIEENIADLCASIQHTLVEVLMRKLDMAVKLTAVNQIAIAGGVSANSLLRQRIALYAEENNLKYFIPAMKYCTDNAAMIGIAAHYKMLKNMYCDQGVTPDAKLPFEEA
jgi:N6-L-threonylcarbamoyladenine synthase